MEHKASRDQVYGVINQERQYQRKWEDPTVTDSCGVHSVLEFLVYIQDYAVEAMHVCSRKGDPEAREFSLHSMRKIAALAVACMEQHGVRERE